MHTKRNPGRVPLGTFLLILFVFLVLWFLLRAGNAAQAHGKSDEHHTHSCLLVATELENRLQENNLLAGDLMMTACMADTRSVACAEERLANARALAKQRERVRDWIEACRKAVKLASPKTP
jgi:hypothetical protein